MVELPVAGNLHFKPFGKCVDALGPYPVQTAGIFIGPLVELAPCMQIGEHEFHGRDLELRMHVDRNSPSVVGNTDGPVNMDRDLDVLAMAGQVLVDRVVQNLKNTVMQPTLIRIPDVHPRPLPDRLQPLQLIDFGSVVLGCYDVLLLSCHRVKVSTRDLATTKKLLFTYLQVNG